MKIIFIVLGIGFVGYIAFQFFMKRANEKFEIRKLRDKILGAKTLESIEEIDYLAKHFKENLGKDWQTKIKENILLDSFKELTEKYKISIFKKDV